MCIRISISSSDEKLSNLQILSDRTYRLSKHRIDRLHFCSVEILERSHLSSNTFEFSKDLIKKLKKRLIFRYKVSFAKKLKHDSFSVCLMRLDESFIGFSISFLACFCDSLLLQDFLSFIKVSTSLYKGIFTVSKWSKRSFSELLYQINIDIHPTYKIRNKRQAVLPFIKRNEMKTRIKNLTFFSVRLDKPQS